ncbi:MAG: hypothetical protein FWD98_00470 [Defluviitaleaceae bacterium]|nr:hypothetical protein [Defluviitaleaceae bacterium]
MDRKVMFAIFLCVPVVVVVAVVMRMSAAVESLELYPEGSAYEQAGDYDIP